jgi:hypothetical protein
LTASLPVDIQHAKDIHPRFDHPRLHSALYPERPLWAPEELRELTELVSGRFVPELLSLVRFDARRRWWIRLALTMGMELWLLSWLPGQGTDPHDHGGARGSFTVVLGELGEDFRFPDTPVRTATRRAGATVAFGPDRAHQLRNTGDAPAASVHAYSPPLRPLRIYRTLGEYAGA